MPDNINLVIGSSAGDGEFINNTITLNTDFVENTSNQNELARVLIHEAIHAVTSSTMDKYVDINADGSAKEKPGVENVPKEVTNLIRIFNRARKEFEKKHPGKIQQATGRTSLTEAQLNVDYGFTNIKEFLTLLATSDEFVKTLANLPYDKGTSVLEKLTQALFDLFIFLRKNIGLETNSELVNDSLQNMFKVIEKQTGTQITFGKKENDLINKVDTELDNNKDIAKSKAHRITIKNNEYDVVNPLSSDAKVYDTEGKLITNEETRLKVMLNALKDINIEDYNKRLKKANDLFKYNNLQSLIISSADYGIFKLSDSQYVFINTSGSPKYRIPELNDSTKQQLDKIFNGNIKSLEDTLSGDSKSEMDINSMANIFGTAVSADALNSAMTIVDKTLDTEKEKFAQEQGFSDWGHVINSMNKRLKEQGKKRMPFNIETFNNLSNQEILDLASKSKSAQSKEPSIRLTPVEPTTQPQVNIIGKLVNQGTSIDLEIKGDTGKEFLLNVNRDGKISLWSEKQPDGSYKAGKPGSKKAIDKLYNKYVSEKTRTIIDNWVKSFSGSWAASETEDGKNYIKAEEKLNLELTAITTQPVIETVEVFKTSDTFSSKVDFAQRGSGAYYGLDKPFKEVGREGKVEKLPISYDKSKTLDATTKEGQAEFMKIKMTALSGKSFNSIKAQNDAVTKAMLDNGYESLIGFIEQDNKEAGRELVIYKQPQVENDLQKRMTEKLPKIANPTAKKHVPKELVKTRIATQYIGDGSLNSSTDRYRKMYAEEGVANTGNYSSSDIVYVSSNGKRKNRVNPVKDGVLQGVYVNVQKAMDVGATIVMDTAAHLKRTANYNIGELALAKYLENNGYKREGDSGIWKPTTQQQVEELDIATLLTNGLVSTKGLKRINVEDAEVFTKQVFTEKESEQVFNFIEQLYNNTYDSEHKASDKFGRGRRSMYFSDQDYSYSGTTRPANLGSPELQRLVSKITKDLGFEDGYFDMVLINEYKDGTQKIGFHTDNEPILNNKGKLNPSVVTISFGDKRTMVLKGKKEYKIPMESGLGLIMGKDGQINYKHGINAEGNKTKRFSITLRHNAEKSQAVDKVLQPQIIPDLQYHNTIDFSPRRITPVTNTIRVPEYTTADLKNKDGSKRFASTNGNNIRINPVVNTNELFDYMQGKEGGITSMQKQLVLDKLESKGYSLERLKLIIDTPQKANLFLILHEQDHILHNDRDVYWTMGRDLLTPDKINIETRATINALKKLEKEFGVRTVYDEELLSIEQQSGLRNEDGTRKKFTKKSYKSTLKRTISLNKANPKYKFRIITVKGEKGDQYRVYDAISVSMRSDLSPKKIVTKQIENSVISGANKKQIEDIINDFENTCR